MVCLPKRSKNVCADQNKKMAYNYHDDPLLGPALAYWLRQRGTRVMPCKRDIDPTEIPRSLLPHLQILDVVDSGARFRYRLIGTALVQAYGRDYTGTYADELVSSERARFIQGVYRAVYERKVPVFSHNRYHTARGRDLIANRLYMPLTHEGSTVDYILGALNFTFGDSVRDGVWGGASLEPTEQYFEPINLASAVAA